MRITKSLFLFYLFGFFLSFWTVYSQSDPPKGKLLIVRKTDAYHRIEYQIMTKTAYDTEKEVSKTIHPALKDKWSKEALAWKTKYKAKYPYPKPEKTKLKIVETKLNTTQANKKLAEYQKSLAEDYVVAKITNGNGSMYEAMLENEAIEEQLKEMKFHLKEWVRYYDKKKRKKPKKPKVRVVKTGFKTKEEANDYISKLLDN